MNKFKIESSFKPSGDQSQAIENLVKGIENKNKYQTLLGVTASGKTFTIANVIEKVNRPTLVLSHNKTLAAQLYRELKDFFPSNAVEYFVSYYDYYQPEAYVPARDLYIDKDASVNDEIDRLRLKATTSLLERRDVIIVASVSCIYGLGSPEDYRQLYIAVEKDEEYDRDEIIEKLVTIQYERTRDILERAKFKVIGDTLEIMSAYADEVIRIDFFGDTVEKIVKINALTRKKISEQDRVVIYPAKHFVTGGDKLNRGIKLIEKELEEQYKKFQDEGKLVEAERIYGRTKYDLEMLKEVGYCAGTTATTMTPANSDVTDIDVKVQLGEPDRLNIDDINRLMIPTSSGMTPISSIATVEKSYGPTEIERKDSARITTITASGYGRALNEIIADIQNKIKNEVFIPSGFSINYSGDFEDMNEAFGQLLQALILALVLVYSIMASQFESFIAPFVIAFAIPFGFAGSLIALFLGRQTLNVYSAIGFIVLIGIVVNNGIVLIDYMNQLMQEKKINGDAAALESGERRLRPVLMTTLTTILGLLPMALASGSGNEMYQPLSLAILGGLIVSTAFTLIIVPTIYAAIRNKIPLKDYEKKDIESIKDFREYEI
ncbi:efflux RND transporter permease subunit [Brachyspira aalborgi]|uniref:Helicase ATP-binding domain-containing protein n=1 Tax=Brachyspira aalborgi TaxID=29522 RepID=A0A5C8EGG8_9SPIR|nr:efflux RND transporter permease subunit [Brachyspira aalborgi]TXJ37049.1 hypothetical protein EPJ78_06885 [Brachyspira aalborgi]